MSKVSVIIPVYNTEKFLRKCLDSVCNQTLQDIEIICINDCSTDGSLEILREYAGKDNRIKLIELFENGGAAKARNIGIDIAHGEYIGFVDSDDFVDLDFYEKLYNKAVETGADAVKGEIWELNDISNAPHMEAKYDLNNFIQKNKAYFYFTFTTAIYKRDFIIQNNIRFPEGLCHLEDPYFTIKAAVYYKKLEIVKYYYVVTQDTRSKKPAINAIIDSLCLGALNILEMLNSLDVSEEHYKIVSAFVLGEILERMDCNNISDSSYNLLLMTLSDFFDRNKHKEQILSKYYSNKRKLIFENRKNNTFRMLRDKQYV